MKTLMKNLGKIMLATFDKILPNRGFRKLRTHWARMISKYIDKKANVCRGAVITGDGSNLYIGSNAAIGIRCRVGSNCHIGQGTMMGPDCIILTQNHKYNFDKQKIAGFETKPVFVGEKCWIGTRVIILPGAKIGDHCIIGAGSVPNKEYPDYSLIVGNPAIVKRSLLK